MRCWIPAVVVVATLTAAAPGCRQVAGIHERAAAADECAACVHTGCAEAERACRAASPCKDRLACASACELDDAACAARCERAFPGAGDAFAAIESCRAGACEPSCGLRCGGIAIAIAEANAAKCEACVASQCCSETAACAASVACTRVLECISRSPAGDALSGCVDFRYPEGTAAWDGFASCRSTRCTDECEVGASWECVGHAAPSLATTDEVELDLAVVDAASQSTPLTGLAVRACSLTDPACGHPASTDVLTDPAGVAAVTIPTATQGGRNGFSGFLEITDPGAKYMPALVFAGTPLTEPRSTKKIIGATRATVAAFFQLVGLTPDVTRGYVISTVSDCLGANATGVTVTTDSTDPLVRVFYLRAGLPTTAARETDAGGSLIVGPLAPGPVTLTARDGVTQQVVGSVRLFVRADTLSLVPVTPAGGGT